MTGEARRFADTATLFPESVTLPRQVRAGEEIQFVSQWGQLRPNPAPRRIFVHLVKVGSDQPIAQNDGLDSPSRFWSSGDWLYQLHRLTVPSDTQPGIYELHLGLYDPISGQRILQTNTANTEPPADNYLLGTIEVTR